MITEGNYTMDRKVLVDYMKESLPAIAQINMRIDLIKGGEYIITTEDLLEYGVKFPSKLVNEPAPEGQEIHHSIIKLTYKQ